jgi:S-DNA-T family DNA segregation ATPase FtsK/SpoIIIE
VVDLWDWQARIGLHRGQTVNDLMNRIPALESGLGTRPGAVRVEPDPDRADHA